MQNRGVFPYRRQGSKKRNRNGADKRPRPPQKGLPNTARDLLPMMQPATKALAQMLSGRAGRSGQLGHAQAIAAQADRLIGERAHNRLNPAEREEFFEQIARLKLTLADAQAEAEEQGAQEPVVKAPPRQLAPARLKEMALALAGPERTRPDEVSEAAEVAPEAAAPPEAEPEAKAAGGLEADPAADRTEQSESAEPEVAESAAEEAPTGRLQLTSSAARAAADALSDDERNLRATRRAQATRRRPGTTPARKQAGDEPSGQAQGAEGPGETVEVDAGDAAGEQQGRGADDGEDGSEAARRAPRRHKQKGVPDGWVIDDEGFVVPGPG